MPAVISGIVFNDLNSNGIFNTGEPGIANVFVVLRDPSGACTNLQTNSSGNYSFTNLTVAGAYTVYETVVNPNACPPTQFTQPTGFNESTTPRQINITVTSAQITGNTTITGNNFGHDNLTPNGCTSFAYQVQGNPSNFTQIDLKTGGTTTLGGLNPSSTFAGTGYNTIDGNFWGYNGNTARIARITQNRTVTDLPAIPNLPVPVNYNNGDVDSNGYLYLYTSAGTTFYVVDVNPNRVTFGRLVNPATGFTEQTIAPFGITIGTTINIADWAFNPQDGLLYGVNNDNGIAVRINPITGVVTNLTTTPQTLGTYGAAFFDNNNNLYAIDNNTGQIFRYAISGNNASRTFFSTSVASGQNDGARCARAPITFAFLSSTKTAPGNVGIGDTFTYTIAIRNTGNTTSTNCVFIDTIPNQTEFITNSLGVNGVTIAGNPNPPGVELGSIPIGTITVTFQVRVTTIPTPNPLINNSTQSYSYQDGPVGAVFNSNSYSNAAVTTVNYVFLPTIKYVDKTNVAVGDIITYTVVTQNTGNFTGNNLFIRDTIPNGTTYVNGSLTGGTGSPLTGIAVGNLLAGAVSTVRFSVTITTIPTPNPIPNVATSTVTFIPNPQTGVVVTPGSSTNTVNTLVSQADITSITKQQDRNFAAVNDIVTYTLTFRNSGNTTATGTIFSDTIPTGTTFIQDSLYVNGNQQVGQSPTSPGISLGNIAALESYTITFKVRVNTIPNPNSIANQGKLTYSFSTATVNYNTLSNNVVATINYANLTSTKIVSKNFGNVGDILTYTIPISNIGNVTVNNIVFLDTIPSGTSLVSNSFRQDGVSISGTPNSPGVTLPNSIRAVSVSTIVFQVRVDTIPNPNPIENSASSRYTYTVDPNNPNNYNSGTNTNSVFTRINNANLRGAVKYVDKSFANCGDVINYTIVIPNTGNVTAQNIILKDTIPNGTSLINTSVFVNGGQQTGVNFANGITIPNIGPGLAATINFSVQVQC